MLDIMFSIESFSNEENNMVKEAAIKYGRTYENANNLILLLMDCVKEIVQPEAWIFIGFLCQVQKSMLLAFLSTIRRHDVQTLMMLRNVLESSVLATYALYQNNPDVYGTINTQGILDINKKTKEKAYKWLDREFDYFSKKIKFFKDYINSTNAHANFGLIFYNIDFSSEYFMASHLFDDNTEDKEHNFMLTMQRLWMIGNISSGLLNLFNQGIKKYPLVSLVDDFESRLSMYSIENDKIKEELSNHPKFSIFKA
jgi:hypothetical protein